MRRDQPEASAAMSCGAGVHARKNDHTETMPLISRRAVLAAPLLLVAAAPALPVPQGNRLAFAIYRKGSRIGTHTIDFTGDQHLLDVRITVDIKVDFGPIVFFHYALRGLEEWRDGELVHAASNTNDDGEMRYARATRNGDRLDVRGSSTQPYMAPPGSVPGSHWNSAEIHHPMINAENGELMQITTVDKGMESVPDDAGHPIAARHYALTWQIGDQPPRGLDLWYEPSGIWASLSAVAKDGSVIVYRRTVG